MPASPDDLVRWTARLGAMQRCHTTDELVARHGTPSHTAPAPFGEIWHYPLGELQGTIYCIRAAVEGTKVFQLYMHMAPGAAPPAEPAASARRPWWRPW